MKILMLLEGVFPQDERVEKEIASLLAAGHEVRIATYSFQSVQFSEEFNGYIIYRKKLSKLMYKFGAAILVLPFYFSFWKKYVKRIADTWDFDAIHIHDLPLAKIGAYYQKRGKYFVADQHEFYSDWIVKTAHYNTIPGKVIKLLSNWRKYEYTYLHSADLVCTVESPIKKLYTTIHGLPEEKIIVIPNTPLKAIYDVEVQPRKDERFILFYCGGMDLLRGLEVPIRSLIKLKEQIPNIMISLVGKVNKHFDPIHYAEELGVADHVEFRGWVHYSDLPKEIDNSDICFFIPPANREEINNTIATKIYQYMARSKPVIVGSARYMKEFVENNGTGIAIDENSSEEFISAVLKLHNDDHFRNDIIQNTRNRMKYYFWDHTVNPLVEFYEPKNIKNKA